MALLPILTAPDPRLKKKSVAVSVRPFEKVSAKDRKAIEAEALSAAAFLAPDAKPDVAFEN